LGNSYRYLSLAIVRGAQSESREDYVISEPDRHIACGAYGFCVIEAQDAVSPLEAYVADRETGRNIWAPPFSIIFETVAQIAQFALISPRSKVVYGLVSVTAPEDHAVFPYAQSQTESKVASKLYERAF
jgi:hypothetical protein